MFRKIVLFLIVFIISISTLGRLKIGIIGDQTGSLDLEKSYSIMQEGCESLGELQPEIVLHVGDIVESSKADDEIKMDFKKAVINLDSIKVNGEIVPWYITAGDHDVNPPRNYSPGSKDQSKKKLFLNLLKDEYLNRYSAKLNIDKLYYSFDFKDYHFISLFSEDNLRTDPRWGNIFMNKIRDKQFKWLKRDLDNAGMKKTIVFLHQPMWYNWTGWQKVHELFRQYNVIAVIAGHFHYNQDEGYKDGIRYLVVGSTGGRTKNASKNAGGIYHVTLLVIDNNGKIELKLIPTNSKSHELPFTNREDMDRVQAIDVMLSMLPYGKYAGRAVEANPIDLPIEIFLSENGKSWMNVFSEVYPGTGIMKSNLSTVGLVNDQALRSENSSGGMRVKFNSGGFNFWIQVLYEKNNGNMIK